MNSFDIAVCAVLAVAVTTGFNTGLLRSAVTILAYLFTTPIAIWVMSGVAPRVGGFVASPLAQNWVLFLAALLAVGMVLGHLARMAVKLLGSAGWYMKELVKYPPQFKIGFVNNNPPVYDILPKLKGAIERLQEEREEKQPRPQ